MLKKKWILTSIGVIVLILVILVLVVNKGLFKSEEEKRVEVVAAVQNEEGDKLKEYIEKKYPINFITDQGITPLEMALNQRSLPIITLLLESGAKVNSESTPLFIRIVSNLDNFYQIGESPSYHETMSDFIELLKLAHQKKDNDINATDEYGNTALHMAAILGHADIINELIELGAGPTITNNDKETPLMLAIKAGQVKATLVLYKYYNSELDRDNEGDTPLYAAAMNGREEVIQYLLEQNIDGVDVQNNEGKTALIIAAEYGYGNIVKILLENGADHLIKSNEGKIALDYATEWEHEDIIQLLNNR